ncbi:MAG: hypothetical protein QNK35_15040 [Bacteroides sp.]|nr:hypothetical protein [Bacteroides sp.]
MKKITILFSLLIIAGVSANAQKKSGVVYSEHEAITKTQELWQASVAGDEAKYRSYFADSALIIRNDDNAPPKVNAEIGKGIAKWAALYENLKIQDYKPAFPDAIEYKEGGTWVQDWLLMTGVHKETGIVVEVPVHNMYSFNEDGKINMMLHYFNNDVFEEIANSKETNKNGEVFINHPYIVTVRKGVNAFVAKDFETMGSYFSPKAKIAFSSMKPGQSINLEEYKKYLSDRYLNDDIEYKMEQVGYPDCLHYEKDDAWVVYSWWNIIVKKDGEKHVLPLMLAHNFNDEGEIVFLQIYASSNHFEIFD